MLEGNFSHHSHNRFGAHITALALCAEVTDKKLIGEGHELLNMGGVFGDEPGFKVPSMITLCAHAGTGQIRGADISTAAISDDTI